MRIGSRGSRHALYLRYHSYKRDSICWSIGNLIYIILWNAGLVHRLGTSKPGAVPHMVFTRNGFFHLHFKKIPVNMATFDLAHFYKSAKYLCARCFYTTQIQLCTVEQATVYTALWTEGHIIERCTRCMHNNECIYTRYTYIYRRVKWWSSRSNYIRVFLQNLQRTHWIECNVLAHFVLYNLEMIQYIFKNTQLIHLILKLEKTQFKQKGGSIKKKLLLRFSHVL